MTVWARLLLASLAVCSCRQRTGAPPVPANSTTQVAASGPTSTATGAPPSFDRPTASFSEVTWRYPDAPLGASEVVVLTPTGATRTHPLPVLVAFHGRGESLKGPKLGARGFIDDYDVTTTVRRLASPPLTVTDLGGFATEQRLHQLNASLAGRPYGGLILVCPYLPDALHGDRAFSDGPVFARFVVEELLPRVYRETPAIGTPKTTGVDGVSLGGRAALLVGLLRPEAFGAVGALQAAIDMDETARFGDLARAAHAKNPDLTLRLLTSDGDYFLEPTLALARGLVGRAVPHRVDVVVGPHSYEFNRGPGGYEMLLFHDRALRAQEGP
jgi:enterochelin esterase-like enzyme